MDTATGQVNVRQIRIRVPDDVDRWLEDAAGGPRRKAAFIRGLIDRERAAGSERQLLLVFDRAAEELTDEDRVERERLVDAFEPRPSQRRGLC